MVEVGCDRSNLKDAILRVWTPAMGEPSIQDLWYKNLCGIMEIGDVDN